jgi:hypothetical protein
MTLEAKVINDDCNMFIEEPIPKRSLIEQASEYSICFSGEIEMFYNIENSCMWTHGEQNCNQHKLLRPGTNVIKHFMEVIYECLY